MRIKLSKYPARIISAERGRIISIFIVTVILCVVLNIPVTAKNYNVNDTNPTRNFMYDIFENAGAEKIIDKIPDSAKEIIGDSSDYLDFTEINKNLSFGFIFNTITGMLGRLLPLTVKGFLPVIALIILGSVANIIKNSLESKAVGSAFDFVLTVCLAGVVFSLVRECFNTAQVFLEDIHNFMLAMTPVMGSLYTVSGNITAAAVNSTGLYAVLGIVETMNSSVIIPALKICFALTLAGSLPNTVNLSGVSAFIRSVMTWLFVFVMSAMAAIIFFQNIIATSADNVAARAVKFTASSFIPVIGGVIGDASRNIMGSISAVKSITGVFGIIIIAVILLPPLITVILNKLMLKLAGALASVLGTDREAGFIKNMGSLLDMTLAVMVSVSVVFIFIITVFIKSAAALS